MNSKLYAWTRPPDWGISACGCAMAPTQPAGCLPAAIQSWNGWKHVKWQWYTTISSSRWSSIFSWSFWDVLITTTELCLAQADAKVECDSFPQAGVESLYLEFSLGDFSHLSFPAKRKDLQEIWVLTWLATSEDYCFNNQSILFTISVLLNLKLDLPGQCTPRSSSRAPGSGIPGTYASRNIDIVLCSSRRRDLFCIWVPLCTLRWRFLAFIVLACHWLSSYP